MDIISLHFVLFIFISIIEISKLIIKKMKYMFSNLKV